MARPPTDIVWRAAVGAQIAQARAGGGDTAAIALLLDLRRFFDSMDFDVLRCKAQALEFPPDLLRVALAAYRWPRVLRARGFAAPPLAATRGVVAGDVFAMALVVAYLFDDFTQVSAGHPMVRLASFVDDSQLQAEIPRR